MPIVIVYSSVRRLCSYTPLFTSPSYPHGSLWTRPPVQAHHLGLGAGPVLRLGVTAAVSVGCEFVTGYTSSGRVYSLTLGLVGSA